MGHPGAIAPSTSAACRPVERALVEAPNVDLDTGAVRINLWCVGSLRRPLVLEEQPQKLRPMRTPDAATSEWVASVLREGRGEEEARALFRRHAVSVHARDGRGKAKEIPAEALAAVAADLDQKLGTSGIVLRLRELLSKMGQRVFTRDSFIRSFWELLWWHHYRYGSALPKRRTPSLRDAHPQHDYCFEVKLGQGSFGEVWLASHLKTGCKRAVKKVRAYKSALEEAEHLCKVDHPNVVRLYEYYRDAHHLYLVMDYCQSGDLRQFVKRSRKAGKKVLEEPLMADLMQQLLRAVAHLHALGIIHRDIKSQNVLVTPRAAQTEPPGRAEERADGAADPDAGPGLHLMLIDFGVAWLARPGNCSDVDIAGTPATTAPEVWSKETTPAADIFSCGCVFYHLLTFKLPFAVDLRMRTGHQDKNDAARDYWKTGPSPDWELLLTRSSIAATYLCTDMLRLERVCRPTATQCLKADFIHYNVPGWRGSDERFEDLRRQLLKAPGRSTLYMSVALAIARKWSVTKLGGVRQLFDALDSADAEGIACAKVRAALQDSGVGDGRAEEVAKAVDLRRDGVLNWTQFVAVCARLSDPSFDSDLMDLFDALDGDGDGLLTEGDISKLFPDEGGRARRGLARDVVQEFFGPEAAAGAAQIDWPAFRRHFVTTEVPL